MIGGLLTGIATSPWMRAALRYGAIAPAVLMFLLSLRRTGEAPHQVIVLVHIAKDSFLCWYWSIGEAGDEPTK